MSTMSEHDNEEFERISSKMMLISFIRYAENSPESIPEEYLVTPEEQAFYDKWLPARLELGSQRLAEEQKEAQAHTLIKRQKANAKRRKAKYGKVEPRHYQTWLPHIKHWLKLRLAWVETPETLGYVQQLICINCEADLFGECADCSVEQHLSNR